MTDAFVRKDALKLLGWVGGSVALGALLPGVAEAEAPRRGGSLKVALNREIIGIDPHGPSAGVDRNVYTSVYNGLVTVDERLKIVPDLAHSWFTPDSRTYIFRLRPNITFHDGTPCNAEAVKRNFDYILDPANASPRRAELSAVRDVSVVDPLTVKFTLSAPFSPFLSIISDRAGYIVSPTARAKYGKDFARNPVGTGPFRFVEWVTDDHITFRRFENYWQKGLPYLDEIVYKPIPDSSVALTELQTGSVDFLFYVDPKDVRTIKASRDLAYLEGAGVGYDGLYINDSKGPLSNPALREAVDLALDRQALLSVAYLGIGQIANGPIAPSSWAYDPTIPVTHRDLAKAKQKLREGGKPNGFTMVLKAENSPLRRKLTQLIQAQLKEVGINVEIQTLEFGSLLAAGARGDFDALSLGWSGRIDPDGNVEPLFAKNGTYNYGKYDDLRVNTLITQARETQEESKRKRLYSELVRKVRSDAAFIFIYFPPTAFAASRVVKGFNVTPDGLMRFRATWLQR